MLEFINLKKRFGNVVAVDDVTLEIFQGQMVGVIGRSGAGKSTLLRLINRLGSDLARYARKNFTVLTIKSLSNIDN